MIEVRRNAQNIISGEGHGKSEASLPCNYGVSSLSGYYTGKIVDILVKSSYCKMCKLWIKKHRIVRRMVGNTQRRIDANHEVFGSNGGRCNCATVRGVTKTTGCNTRITVETLTEKLRQKS